MSTSVRASAAQEMFATGVARGFCCEDPLSAEGQRDASAPPASKTVVFFANTSWYLWNFRLTLAKRLQNRGFRVVFVAPHHDDFSSRLSGAGEFIPIRISRDGMHPVMEFGTLICFWLLVRRLDAHVVLSWTPKCNIYGGLACRSLGIPIIPNVSGLGSAFVDPTRLARIVAYLYRHAFKKCGPVFFQNSQDMENLIDWGCIGRNSAKLLPGSGVDLNRFIPGSMDALEERDQFVFLFMGRLLREKGLRELATAMRRIREDGLKARLLVVGFVDKANPSGLDAVELDAWVQEGLLEHLGETDMPESFFCRADCVVHPSFYREGLARVLLEAAACGRPVITTDVAGCREAVVPEVSGFLCKPRDADSLYGAMKRMLLLPGSVRQEMGVAARKHMERGFSEEIVIESYFDALHAIAA